MIIRLFGNLSKYFKSLTKVFCKVMFELELYSRGVITRQWCSMYVFNVCPGDQRSSPVIRLILKSVVPDNSSGTSQVNRPCPCISFDDTFLGASPYISDDATGVRLLGHLSVVRFLGVL